MTENQANMIEFGCRMLYMVKDAIRNGAFECDSEQMADIAVECGLIQNPIYDPVVHGTDIEAEPGDRIYFWEGNMTWVAIRSKA